MGLHHPETGERFHAVVQLRKENKEGTAYNLVGFQTKLTYPEQRKVFATIPGLEKAEFFRYGAIHRNTFLNTPALLTPQLSRIEPARFGPLPVERGVEESSIAGDPSRGS